MSYYPRHGNSLFGAVTQPLYGPPSVLRNASLLPGTTSITAPDELDQAHARLRDVQEALQREIERSASLSAAVETLLELTECFVDGRKSPREGCNCNSCCSADEARAALGAK